MKNYFCQKLIFEIGVFGGQIPNCIIQSNSFNFYLKQAKGKYQRAILYVSGDALRVVDEISKVRNYLPFVGGGGELNFFFVEMSGNAESK